VKSEIHAASRSPPHALGPAAGKRCCRGTRHHPGAVIRLLIAEMRLSRLAGKSCFSNLLRRIDGICPPVNRLY
jgi:hypothetical protein